MKLALYYKFVDLLEKYYFIQNVQFNITTINRNNKISLYFT